MPNRTSYPFAFSSQYRCELGEALAPGKAVVATLLSPPRAQLTPEEWMPLGSGAVEHQWGFLIGPDPCNKLCVMHRAIDQSFGLAELVIRFKSNPGTTTSKECRNGGYLGPTTHYIGSALGVIVVARSEDGSTLLIRAHDMWGANRLTTDFAAQVPAHWEGNCAIGMRGDHCLAAGVVTV
ncbi:hypothetical protein NA78x_004052 [Anatilimnocola sp. NA78]|uniref:hypothetical protein n=1 Tax=Anatilimnocola sp. NA78 TaxID=3415683 RepID=UPI003CE53403